MNKGVAKTLGCAKTRHVEILRLLSHFLTDHQRCAIIIRQPNYLNNFDNLVKHSVEIQVTHQFYLFWKLFPYGRLFWVKNGNFFIVFIFYGLVETILVIKFRSCKIQKLTSSERKALLDRLYDCFLEKNRNCCLSDPSTEPQFHFDAHRIVKVHVVFSVRKHLLMEKPN